MQGNNFPAGQAALIPGAPSIVGLNSDRSIRTGDDPFRGARPVDLSADTTFTATTMPRAIYVGTAGNVKVDIVDIDGTTVLTAKLIKAGDFSVPPFASIRKIYSTTNGTTAADIWIGV
jgi:hypothetical protein